MIITAVVLCSIAGLNLYLDKTFDGVSKYKYFEFGDSGYMERTGSITNNKFILKIRDNYKYQDTKRNNFVMLDSGSETLINNIMGTINEFCKINYCKTYNYLGKERYNGNNVDLYHYSNNLTAVVSTNNLLYFTIPDDSVRPSQCLYLVTNQSGERSCKGLDERLYYKKYSELINKLVNGSEVDIEYMHDPLLQKFSFIVTFKYAGLPSQIKWYLDFGPNGVFSFVGTNFYVEIAKNFKNISLEKSISYYRGNKAGYKLIPELNSDKIYDLEYDKKDLLIIKKIGEVIRLYTDFDGKIYILPHYELYTNKGVYLLLGSEKV